MENILNRAENDAEVDWERNGNNKNFILENKVKSFLFYVSKPAHWQCRRALSVEVEMIN